MSAPDDDALRAILAGLRHGDVRITANRCTGDIRAVEAFCDLIRAAPSLAAEVLRLRETNRALGPSLAAARADFHAMEEAFYATQARAEAAEAIIGGRTVPPTAEEIEAHHAAGGAWLLRWPWRDRTWASAICWRGVRDEWQEGAVCIALDRARRPCAWPVAGGGR